MSPGDPDMPEMIRWRLGENDAGDRRCPEMLPKRSRGKRGCFSCAVAALKMTGLGFWTSHLKGAARQGDKHNPSPSVLVLGSAVLVLAEALEVPPKAVPGLDLGSVQDADQHGQHEQDGACRERDPFAFLDSHSSGGSSMEHWLLARNREAVSRARRRV